MGATRILRDSFFSALDEDENGPPPEFVVPLAHLTTWSLSTLSAGPKEGQETVILPIWNFF